MAPVNVVQTTVVLADDHPIWRDGVRADLGDDFRAPLRIDTPALLVEAGYISNVDDEALLVTPAGRAPLVLVLAQAIEADLAQRRLR